MLGLCSLSAFASGINIAHMRTGSFLPSSFSSLLIFIAHSFSKSSAWLVTLSGLQQGEVYMLCWAHTTLYVTFLPNCHCTFFPTCQLVVLSISANPESCRSKQGQVFEEGSLEQPGVVQQVPSSQNLARSCFYRAVSLATEEETEEFYGGAACPILPKSQLCS